MTLHGAVQRLPDHEHFGRIAFRVEQGAIRLGEDETPVDVAVFVSGDPYPLQGRSAAVLDHLRGPGACDQMAACLRAHGHDARFAEPVALDRHGLTVLAVGPDGVSTVRLPFPFPISELSDLPGDLHVLLAPTASIDRRPWCPNRFPFLEPTSTRPDCRDTGCSPGWASESSGPVAASAPRTCSMR